MNLSSRALFASVAVVAFASAACGSSDDDQPASEPTTAATDAVDSTSATVAAVENATDTTVAESESQTQSTQASGDASGGDPVTFTAEVWADNWFALYANGLLVGEDSVPITTERSFNAETITFEASYPLTIGVEAKDFKETDSGIEYIGLGNQQMGDGGLILQITDDSTGAVVAASSGAWLTLVIHRAPLNTECERDADPDTTCLFEITDAPQGWADSGFDDSGWDAATEWSEADVSPKDGYDEIAWDSTARLIWGSDLEVDNTILLRLDVGA